MPKITSYFSKEKRKSTTRYVVPTKMTIVESIADEPDEPQVIVPTVKYNSDITFHMLSMLQGGNNSNATYVLFAKLKENTTNSTKIDTYYQVFNEKDNIICKHLISFKDIHNYYKNRATRFKRHLDFAHPDIDHSKSFYALDYLCSWSGVTGIGARNRTIFDFPNLSKDPDVFEEFCIWLAESMISYRAVDKNSFKNGFGLHVPQFAARWNRRNVSKQIIYTGNKIMTDLQDSCQEMSESAKPESLINLNSSTTDIRSLLNQKFHAIKNIGSPFCSIESDDWLSNTNREYTGININFLGASVTIHTITVRLFEVKSKSKKAHTELLKSTALNYGFSNILSSITTDNCSTVLGSGDSLKDTTDFPNLGSHIGCLAHQISLITICIIAEFSRAFLVTPDSELEILLQDGDDCQIPFEEYEEVEDDDFMEEETFVDDDSDRDIIEEIVGKNDYSEDDQDGDETLTNANFDLKNGLTNQKEKLNAYKNPGKRINKTENYRPETSNRISVRDYLTDPFDRKSISPLATLIKFSIEVRRSTTKYQLFNKIVKKTISSLCSYKMAC